MADQQNTQNKNDAASATGTSGAGSAQNQNAAGSNPSFGGGSSGQGVKGAQEKQSGGGSAEQVASAVGDVLRGDTSTVTDSAKNIVSQVKVSGGKVASEAIGQVKEKAVGKIEEQKATLAQGLDSVAQTIRQVGSTLKGAEEPTGVATTTADYGDKLARQVEQFSDYLEKHNVSQLMKDVEGFARRNPAYFIGGAFLLGFLGARFLKSSNSGNGGNEVFHGQAKTKLSSEGLPITTSGEGVRPV